MIYDVDPDDWVNVAFIPGGGTKAPSHHRTFSTLPEVWEALAQGGQ